MAEKNDNTIDISRRSLAAGVGILSAAVMAGRSGQAQAQPAQADEDDPRIVEQQWSGDGNEVEILDATGRQIDTAVYDGTRADYAPRDPKFAENMLATCASFVGQSRAETPERIQEYLRLFTLGLRDEKTKKYVPFCAAGLSYAAAHTYSSKLGRGTTQSAIRGLLGEVDRYHFFPSPSVWDIVYGAMAKRKWASRADAPAPKPGWLVVYDWGRNGGANHVGILEKTAPGVLHTIEFNTAPQAGSGSQSNGGVVTRRIRKLDGTVKGFVRTDRSSPFELDT